MSRNPPAYTRRRLRCSTRRDKCSKVPGNKIIAGGVPVVPFNAALRYRASNDALLADDDVVVLNATRDLLKERNLRRDPRVSLCVEDGMRYVTLEGRAELVEDRAQQESEVNNLSAPRYIGQRLGSQRWDVIKDSDRIGIRMHVEKVLARGI